MGPGRGRLRRSRRQRAGSAGPCRAGGVRHFLRLPFGRGRGRYDAARLPRIHPSGAGAQRNERTVMGNAAVAEELAGVEELDELYRLDASESEPEDEEDEEEEDDGDEPDGDEPDVVPHG